MDLVSVILLSQFIMIYNNSPFGIPMIIIITIIILTIKMDRRINGEINR